MKGQHMSVFLTKNKLLVISLVHLLKPSFLLIYTFLHGDNSFFGYESLLFLTSLAICILVSVTMWEIPLEHSSSLFKANLIFTNISWSALSSYTGEDGFDFFFFFLVKLCAWFKMAHWDNAILFNLLFFLHSFIPWVLTHFNLFCCIASLWLCHISFY